MNIFSRIIDRWMTKYTGKSWNERRLRKWFYSTVVVNAITLEGMFAKFQYIVEVDPAKFFDPSALSNWIPVKACDQYAYPNRELGDNAIWHWARGDYYSVDNQFHFDGCFGKDYLFVATNNEQDAAELMMLYSKDLTWLPVYTRNFAGSLNPKGSSISKSLVEWNGKLVMKNKAADIEFATEEDATLFLLRWA